LEISRSARCERATYSGDGDWTAGDIRFDRGRTFFEARYRGKSEGTVEVGLIGRHNVNNALAVYALGRMIGLERNQLLEGFRTFCGVKRRQEVLGERRGVLVMDDFAHHPTAVRETIEAVKAAYQERRLWAIFEPRSNTSKRNIFEKEFADALTLADRIVIAGIYQPEKIPEGERISVESVARSINQRFPDPRAYVIAGAADIALRVSREARAGDLILVMSNGGFDGVQQKILEALAR
jgi:UDP-N-acetylmuramate: L-alanyl-gamma-D-glutamyl-meso-diaminopimelate ligase